MFTKFLINFQLNKCFVCYLNNIYIISSIRPYSEINGNVKHFSTSGLDGKLVIWDLKSLESQFGKLKV